MKKAAIHYGGGKTATLFLAEEKEDESISEINKLISDLRGSGDSDSEGGDDLDSESEATTYADVGLVPETTDSDSGDDDSDGSKYDELGLL